MNNEKTGNLIRSIRTEKGLTQKQLADELHVSSAAVSKWENGHGFPDVSLLEPLASALDITVTELVSGYRAPELHCTEDPARDILNLSRTELNCTKRKIFFTVLLISIITAVGFLLIVRISPLHTVAPLITSIYGSVFLNLLALAMGFSSWICAGIGIFSGRKKRKGLWQRYTIASLGFCCISLYLPILLMTGFSRTEDIIMFLDTMGGYHFGAMVLLFITITLNITSAIINQRNSPFDC